MNPQSISENLLYSTVRIIASNGGTGTGFFYVFKFGDTFVPTIITNKHVVNYNQNELTKFFLHTHTDGIPDKDSIEINFNTNWIFHSTHDLCFCFINPLIDGIKNRSNKEVFFKPITKELLPTEEQINDLTAIEDVIMVGYPIGLWDQTNNFPLFRKGITASHPKIDFNRGNIGAIDMACFPGSSGSPIFILNENGYKSKNGTNYMGATRMIFLGILFEGPVMNATGEISIEKIPTSTQAFTSTKVMINMGYYIKSNQIIEFENYISKLI